MAKKKKKELPKYFNCDECISSAVFRDKKICTLRHNRGATGNNFACNIESCNWFKKKEKG